MTTNLVLIGMPGAGKSTIGVLLAKALMRHFVDTDLVIQAAERKRLNHLIRERGPDGFRALEEFHVLALTATNSVIATGGSVVYSPAAMAHLKALGPIVWLDLPLAEIAARLGDLTTRGVVIAPGQTLAELYAERLPLYRQYADITVPVAGMNHGACVSEVLQRLQHDGLGQELR